MNEWGEMFIIELRTDFLFLFLVILTLIKLCFFKVVFLERSILPLLHIKKKILHYWYNLIEMLYGELKLKHCLDYLIYSDDISFLQQVNVKISETLAINAKIHKENLHFSWKTWQVLIKFSGEMLFIIMLKLTKSQGSTLSLKPPNWNPLATLFRV